jgi:hypothetical protein
MLVATAAKPGTNLATTSDAGPQRAKICSLCRTQLSGDSDSRHISRSTRRPWRLPAAYHNRSATTLASTATPTTCHGAKSLREANAPTTINVG